MKGNNKRAILIYVIGFVIARASFLGINPLAIGFFTAAYLEKVSPGILFLTILVGIGSVMSPTMVLKYLLTMISAVVLLESPFLKKRELPTKIYFYIPAVLLGIFAMMEAAANGWKPDFAMMAVLEAIIAYVSGMIFSMGTGFIIKQPKGTKMTNEEMISLSLMVAVIIYGIPNISNPFIAPIETLVYFVIMLFTYKYGAGQGAVTGAVAGFALSLRGEPLSGIAMLTMMGIVPALFRSLGRIPTAAVFSLTTAIISLVYEEAAISIREIGALSSALLLFLLLPKSIIYRVDYDKDGIGQSLLSADNLKKLANTRMKIFSDSFLKLSKTLETITERQTKIKQKEIDLIFEDISERLCKNCKNCSFCWESHFKEAYKATCDMFEVAEKKGYIENKDIPEYFLEFCICSDELVLETNRGFEIAKLNNIWSNRLAESREVIAGQLKEVSSAIHTLTGDIYSAARVMRNEEGKVIRRLRTQHIDVKNITVVERKDKRKELVLNAAVGKNRCITTKEAASWISEVLGVKFVVSGASKSVLSKKYEEYIFVEDTKFKVLTGVARAMKDSISGDNFSIMKLESGEEVIALADGMGTGKEAADESETVLALLEQLLEAGFKTETAVKLINSNLVLKADKQTFSTIDIGTINLCTGMCEFVKIGAASTFIKRENWVETISSTTLPIGMFKAVDYDSVTKKLYEGDIVIMVTDGVLDCLQIEDKEKYMEKIIMDIKSNNPQEIANRILDHTLSQRNYIPMDDMTVIAAGIWLK
ncbi:MAG: stage II sporulation protein E [Anaerolineaceae bacterium]|nr:MAG: stage II sporulation protein E [Anaerolineaceae bacterium]